MKSVITAICLLIPLVIIFVIIDRKDSYSGDDVAVQQETVRRMNPTTVTTIKPVEKTAETKSVAKTKPTETKPAEPKPAKEKPTEMKPVEESKYAETKPVVETKSVETKAVVGKEKLVPAAVPVVATEEAEKLNEEAREYAIAEKERREPFFRLYQNNKLDGICFEGTVRAASIIPDPAKNDYDNCLYALLVEIDSVLSVLPDNHLLPCEVLVNAPIMRNKSILQENIFIPGDKIRCICTEYDAMPQSIQEIQLSDDIQSYEHQQYYPLNISKITAFSKNGNRNFAKREITILPIQTLPKDEKAALLRKERIKNEIARIKEQIKKHGGSFETWKEEYKTIADKYKLLSSEGYKGWINDSFFAAGGHETSYRTKEYIEGILPYKEYLEKNNIDLIVVRIPSKWDFAARVLASDTFQENPVWMEHYYECLKNDIEIIDPMHEMWKHRFDFPLFYYYQNDDIHPYEGTSFVLAQEISKVLDRYDFTHTESPLALKKIEKKKEGFFPEGNKKYSPLDSVIINSVIQNDKTIGPLDKNTGSPFLFLSNSFFINPSRNDGAHVPAYTAFFIQHIPDWFLKYGIGNGMLRLLVSDTNALSHRKAVIMGEHPSFWDGFPQMPQYLPDNAKRISLEQSNKLLSQEIQIIDNNRFLFSEQESSTLILLNNSTGFSIEFPIPLYEEKKMCMLRLVFEFCSCADIIAYDAENNNIIDSTTLSSGANLNADLFIPNSFFGSKIRLFIKLYSPERKYSIKTLEFWYY